MFDKDSTERRRLRILSSGTSPQKYCVFKDGLFNQKSAAKYYQGKK
jgi:hypothetical protein